LAGKTLKRGHKTTKREAGIVSKEHHFSNGV